MCIGNILIFISLATLFGASDGKPKEQSAKLVDEVNKHLKNLERKRSTGQRTGFTKWDNIANRKKNEYFEVDFVKGR